VSINEGRYRADNRPASGERLAAPTYTATSGEGWRRVTMDHGNVVHVYEDLGGGLFMFDIPATDGWRFPIAQDEFEAKWECCSHVEEE